MPYEFSLPTNADEVPTGPDWLHEVTPATVADHVVWHRGEFAVFKLGQLRSDCHNVLGRTNSPRAPVRADGTPSDPNHPWNR
jgi:hypothetical protein